MLGLDHLGTCQESVTSSTSALPGAFLWETSLSKHFLLDTEGSDANMPLSPIMFGLPLNQTEPQFPCGHWGLTKASPELG